MNPVSRPRVSVIIPTLNEAPNIVGGLENLREQGADEVLVVDASSLDGTAARAEREGARVLISPRGRGVQQNLGAREATGDVLLFLHADCRLARGSIACLREYVRRHPRVPAGCFRMRVDAPDLAFRAIDAAAHVRAGVFGVPYGDQGIFVTRWTFDRVGGFPEVALMEDLRLGMKLRRLGRIALLPARIHVSPRRWRHQGIVRQTLRNWRLTLLAVLGVSDTALARHYPAVREDRD